ncbi:MAG: T9SS type A sorting domain-containing protein [Ignavibacteriae bacterium]|nr:T9SS type A sorting domain-containing protein [Ignavibacteriota bacterium]
MWIKKITVLFLLFGSIAFAQNALPTEGLKHHITFDNAGDLETATVGNNLQRDALTGVTQLFNAVQGPTGGNGAVEVGLGSFYRLDLDFDANGPDTASRVNQYSLVIDFYLPITGVWYAFHATTNDGDAAESDWESFVRDNGAIGVGATGYSLYKIPEKEWHRLVISADLGNSYKYFLDGQLVQDGGAQSVDGRFSLPTIDGANQILLFGDNDGEDANIYISELGIYDRPLTSDEIWAMGGYGHSIPLQAPAGLWTFDDSENLLLPFYGNELELVGEHAATPGPESGDGAVTIGVGSHYSTKHDIASNGGGERVNEYSIAIDFKVDNLGSWYCFMQTDITNTSDGELFINPDGKIGVGDLGYTQNSIVAGDWYRLVMTVDLDSAVKVFLDGDSVLYGGPQEIDNRFSLNPRNLDNRLLLFADNDGEDNIISTAKVTIYNRALNQEEISGLGGYEHGAPNTEVTGGQKAVYFNGNDVNNKYGKIVKTNEDFNFGEGDFTIELWAKPDVNYDSDPALVSDKDWASGGNPGWVISIRGDDWKFNAADNNRNRYDVSAPAINDGNWHYLAVVAKQDSGLKLITDTLQSVWAGGEGFFNVGNIDNPTMPICVAQDGTEKYTDAPPAPAQVDELRIWKGVAVDPEVLFAWKNKEINESHPYWSSLVGYWKFNEGDGNTVADLSGKNHPIELIGNPKWEISYAVIGNETVQTMTDVTSIWGAGTLAKSGGLIGEGSFPFPETLALSKTEPNNNLSTIFAKEDNPYLVFGHNNAENATASRVPSGVEARLGRIWYLDVTETPITEPTISFDLSDLGGSGNAGDIANYVLLNSVSAEGNFTEVSSTIAISEDQITFSGMTLADGYYTLGTKSLANSPLGGLLVGIENLDGLIPQDFNLSQNYPNPFNPSTKINFALPVSAKVNLTIYNVLGEIVETLINGEINAGYHSIDWKANSNLSSGMYIYSINATSANGKNFTKSFKLMLLK